MTHTPASGPLTPVITPPISAGPIRIGWAPTWLGLTARNAVTMIAAAPAYEVRVALMPTLLVETPGRLSGIPTVIRRNAPRAVEVFGTALTASRSRLRRSLENLCGR